MQYPRNGSFALGIPCLTIGTSRLTGLGTTVHDRSATGVAGKRGGVLRATHDLGMLTVGEFLFHLVITEDSFERVQLIAVNTSQSASLLKPYAWERHTKGLSLSRGRREVAHLRRGTNNRHT
jgi:hypothetical protein